MWDTCRCHWKARERDKTQQRDALDWQILRRNVVSAARQTKCRGKAELVVVEPSARRQKAKRSDSVRLETLTIGG